MKGAAERLHDLGWTVLQSRPMKASDGLVFFLVEAGSASSDEVERDWDTDTLAAMSRIADRVAARQVRS